MSNEYPYNYTPSINYKEILPNAKWRESQGGWFYVYALHPEGGTLVLDEYSVVIGGMGRIPRNLAPKNLQELRTLALALKMEIL